MVVGSVVHGEVARTLFWNRPAGAVIADRPPMAPASGLQKE